MRHVRRHGALLLILLLALALRLALWAQPLHQPANDENEYIAVAYDLLAGQGWRFYESYHWLRAPLYPLFLAGSLWLAGGNLHLAALPNIALSVGVVYLVYLLTLALQAGGEQREEQQRRVALLAALLAAVLLTLATFASLSMSETLFSFFFGLAVLLLLRWQRSAAEGVRDAGGRRWLLLVLAGVAYGLATLTRSVTVAFLPLLALWVAAGGGVFCWWGWRGWRAAGAALLPALARGGLFVVVVLMVVAPWTLRNCHAYERCILVETGLSFNLWAFSEPHEERGEIFRVLESIANPAERADEATRRGLARLQEDPAILLRKLWPNWVFLWRVKPIEDRFLLPNYYVDPPPLLFLAALLFDDALYLFILVAGIAGAGALLTRRSTRFAALLLAAWIGYIALTTMLTHGEARYRHFFFVLLIPLAAIGCHRLKAWLRDTSRAAVVAKLLTAPLLVLLLFTVFVSYPWEWASGGAARSSYRLMGDAAAAVGAVSLAEEAYQRAYAAQKTSDGRLILGNFYHQQGNLERAEEHYRAAHRRQRRYVAASASLGNLLREQGRAEEARKAFAGYFIAEQDVTDWSWEHLEPLPTTFIDVGGKLDYGYMGGFYNAEPQQGASARWSNGRGLLRVAGGGSFSSAAEGVPESLLLGLRIAAPHPGTREVAAQVCAGGHCQLLVLPPTWRVVWLIIPAAATPSQVVEVRSPTFQAADGRRLGVLVDRVWVRRYSTSHSLTSWSSEAEARVFPSGAKATLVTLLVWPRRVCSSVPSSTRHSWAVWSSSARASVLLSGEKATSGTPPDTRRVRSSVPVSARHSITVRSSDPEARVWPSGEKATQNIQFLCPSRARSGVPSEARHICTALLPTAAATARPSVEKATLHTSPSSGG
jgi:4-amino-4-deoxy-L-arabinose transferase-like glycosyltransferase